MAEGLGGPDQGLFYNYHSKSVIWPDFNKGKDPGRGEFWIGLPYLPTGDTKFMLKVAYPFREPLINYLRCYCCVKNQLKMRMYDL